MPKLPKIELKAGPSPDAYVLCWHQAKPEKGQGKPKDKDKKRQPTPPVFPGKKTKEISAMAEKLGKTLHFVGRKNEACPLFFYSHADCPHTMLLGLGPEAKWDAETARQAGATTFLCQRRARFTQIALDAESFFAKVKKPDVPYYLQAFCEGYWLAGYRFDDLRKEQAGGFQPTGVTVVGLGKNAQAEKAINAARILSKSVMFARSLGDRPGNYLPPAQMAKIVEQAAKESGLKTTVYNLARIQKEKMGLLEGVGRGSHEEPRFIKLEHWGGKKSDPPIALIGKGITFDSGGISLKPATRMEEMKYDMMGSATVAGTCLAVSELKLPINVIGFIAAAENMPSGHAQKPGDVVYSMSGKSVEITNTDAEGRLVLADALEYAQKYHKPQAIIDFATLTGAVVVALGSCASGIMGTSPKLIDRIKASAKVTGEKVWELPLFEEYEELLKSAVADIKNASDIREAGSSKGGTFLKYFVSDDIPWVHCDIAGSGMQRRDLNYCPRRSGAGVMVRLTTHMLQNWKRI